MRIIDMHCHLLPHVDDGARSLKEAVQMVNMLWEQGVKVIIATPHYRKGMFEPSMERVQAELMRVRRASRAISDDIKIYLGCEFHANMDMQWILSDRERPTLAGSSYVLTEFEELVQETYLRERVRTLTEFGYIPVIAHIERYRRIVRDMDFIEELSSAGARIQADAGSIVSEKAGTRRFCRRLIEEGLLDFIGSDAHGIKYRAPQMRECWEYLAKRYGTAYARRIMEENPDQILRERKI